MRYIQGDIPKREHGKIILATFAFLALNMLGAIGNIALSTSIVGAMLILVSQSFLSSFVSGLYILVARPFNYGDRIQIGEYIGDVFDIGMISTKIKTPYNEIVTIPNSKFLGAEIKIFKRKPARSCGAGAESEHK